MAACTEHGAFLGGICVWCGQQADDRDAIAFDYLCEGLKLASSEIDSLRRANTAALLQQKKLVLVLDLDHTLLHSVHEVVEEQLYLVSVAHDLRDDPGRSLFLLDGGDLMTKLRPFVRTFLEKASTMFQMYIYTMGSRLYALDMAKLLDPDGVLFKNRVISMEDCTTPHQKGLDIVLEEESVVVVLDDTRSVWERHTRNLIQMEGYNFFASGSGGPRPGIMDEHQAHFALETTLDVLKKLHRMFFDADISSRDTRELLEMISDDVASKSLDLPRRCNLPQPLSVDPAVCSM